MNPNAQKEEKLGRDIFDTLAKQLNWDVEYTTEQYDPIDLHIHYITKNGRKLNIGGEIKNRNASAITFSTHIITLHKIKALLKYNKHIGMFINIIGDDIFIYNVTQIARLILEGQLKPKQWRLPNCNVADSGQHFEKVVEVNKSLAVHFKLINGIWTRL